MALRHDSGVEMKDSGVEWLGKIPSHWDVSRIARVAVLAGGGTPDSHVSEYWDGEIPWLTPSDVSSHRGMYIEHTTRNITQKGLSNSSAKLMPPGTILMTSRASIGDVVICAVPMATNQGFICIAPDSTSLFNEYLARWIYLHKEYIQQLGSGSTFLEVTKSAFKALPVPLPPLHEQRAIASYLDAETARIDALIGQTERLTTLLREKRTALISQAVTKGLAAGVDMKDSGVEWLGEIPSHWEVRRLKYVVEVNPKKSELRSISHELEVAFLPMESIGEQGELELDRVNAIRDVYNGYTYFRENDVLVAKITPCFENGKGAIARGLANRIGFGTTELFVLRPCPDTNSDFVYYVTVSTGFRNLGTISMQGAAGQKRVTENFIKDFVVSIPPHSEQRAIAAYLDRETAKIDRLIAKNGRLISLLREKRSALISAAVTGKIAVPSAPSVVKQ